MCDSGNDWDFDLDLLDLKILGLWDNKIEEFQDERIGRM
jgi:hypothetical protein